MMANTQLARRGLGSPLPLYSEPKHEYSGMPMKLSESTHGCRWIIEHERDHTESLICGAPCDEGKSFCPAHLARVFVKVTA